MKWFFINLLEMWLHQLKNNECTDEQLDSLGKIAKNQIVTKVTIQQLADKFDKPPHIIRSVIYRNDYKGELKPDRTPHYDYNKFVQYVPDKWREQK